MRYKILIVVATLVFQLAVIEAGDGDIQEDASPSVVVKYLQDNLIHVMKRGNSLGYKGRFPGMIVPPYTKTDGKFNRAIAIIVPGRLLSQPAIPTRASY